MPTTVGQHAVAAFTSPVNGTSPIDATTVRGNDNTLRTSYVNHDADPGIHVQSSDLASRPAAGVTGRKWMTVDNNIARLWYDTGSVWVESTPSTKVASVATVDLSAGTAVTLLTHSLTNIAAGDVIEVTFDGAFFNQSGNSRFLTYTFTVGSYSTTIVGPISPTDANATSFSGTCRIGVVSSSSVVSVAGVIFNANAAKGATGAGSDNRGSYNDGSNNITGTQTVTVSVQGSAAVSNLAVRSSIVQCRLIKGV